MEKNTKLKMCKLSKWSRKIQLALSNQIIYASYKTVAKRTTKILKP